MCDQLSTLFFFFSFIIIFWCGWIVRGGDSLTRWQETWLNSPCLLSVAAWPAERAAYGATQIWVASGYLHHKSLGVPPQSWRHVDHSWWTLGPAPPLLAYCSTAPSALHNQRHPLCPGASVTLVTHVGLVSTRSVPVGLRCPAHRQEWSSQYIRFL